MNFVEWGNKWLEEENEKKKQHNQKSRKAWNEAYPEKVKAARRKYCEANREKVNEHLKVWRKNHREKTKATNRAWYKAYPEQVKAQTKRWIESHPNQMGEIRRRSNSKRKRNLGYVPLNTYFDGSHAHHIDKDYIIYIPSELHKSISHSVLTGKNMKEINKLVLDYLKGERR